MSEQSPEQTMDNLNQTTTGASDTATEKEFLDNIRQNIDAVDCEIQTLINNRAKLAQQVAMVKKNHTAADDNSNPIFYRPEREAQVLKAVMERNAGPIADEKMARLFREIMSVCLDLEAPQRIAFLGPVGTFTHAAALKHFGKAADTVPMTTITDVFREVEAGTAMYGVVPVENSSEGVVNHTLDGFLSSTLKIIGEVELPIHQNFLVAEHTKIDGLSRIYSHQQSLAQCRHWLDVNFPNVERVAVSSNGEAARRLKNEWHSAAIAGDVAVAEYGLHKLYSNIEDNPSNTTRFLIIGHEAIAPSGQDKTSIVVSAHDKAGALIEILKPLSYHGVSMTSIETRPERPNKWAYVFFIDMNGHVNDPNVSAAINDIRPLVKDLRILGSYPKAVL
ncbi:MULTISPECIES: prephenate dehydratase [Psychrobacter]|uniref:prephenate dehydratase n=1 Tax=Psychrobacter TaxID=497 RepID=UPI000433F9FA|nr:MULTISPECIES: prephenate dehydratase [unclassified Psychrobacter]MCG3859534.1 prephenate dehydratase [Psychrobacter sp. Ps2]MDN3440696.1 prephenate dehydratase [Psychrobacter sp. APC 3279]PKH64179.1 prephenate dehydratase [Psychrobacter sp. 4Dc]PLT23808.1 prephenate dehydratase [Psychrobacter sp. MES7-P7E]QOD13801.1 prephenate dehydratase [Psychrobacter sp. 28M-43]